MRISQVVSKKYWRNLDEVIGQNVTVLSVTKREFNWQGDKVQGLVIELEGLGYFTTSSRVLREQFDMLVENGITPPFRCKIVRKGRALHFADPDGDTNQTVKSGGD